MGQLIVLLIQIFVGAFLLKYALGDILQIIELTYNQALILWIAIDFLPKRK